MADRGKRPGTETVQTGGGTLSEPADEAGPGEKLRSPSSPPKTFWDRAFAPVDIGFLVYFRIVFGAVIVANVTFYYAIGAVDAMYVEPRFHFPYFGFEWIRPWPGIGIHLHFAALGLLAVFMAFGLFYRASSVLFALAFTHFFLIDRAYFQNHYYLLFLVSWTMTLLPAHRALSVDAIRQPSVHSSTVPAWTLWLLRFHIGVPYFFGGVAKLNSDWLAGEPMRSVLAARTWYPVIGRYFTEEWCVQFFVQGGLWFDLLVVPGLLWRRTRVFAFFMALIFNLTNHTLFYIGIFPWFMMFATVVFFRPDWPRRLLRLPRAVTEAVPQGLTWSALTRDKRAGALLLGTYILFQLTWPFRTLGYEGNPSWTEQGHFFSWHMMLRQKKCIVRFNLTHPATGVNGTVDPLEYISPYQFMMMSNDPCMIRDFSHFLARDFREMNHGEVEVRAVALVSLNGRKPQLLIDPTVNLAAEPRTIRRPDWIIPLTEPFRKEVWNVPRNQWKDHVDLPPLPFLKQQDSTTGDGPSVGSL